MKEKKFRSKIYSRRVLPVVASVLAFSGLLVALWADKGTAAAKSLAEVVYSAKDFQNGKARFYSYPAGDGVTVKYFVLKSSDGVIRAAFDACDVCFQEGKGYTQKDDFMVCRNCGRRFASVRVNEVQGGCNPAPLARTIKGDKVVLQVKDILLGKQYFNFGRSVWR